jgi:hypothetical protein
MDGKERMLTALAREVPDRMPVTIHQWQDYHLKHYMGGVDQIEAFRLTGLDASVTPLGVGNQDKDPNWLYERSDLGEQDGVHHRRHSVTTPDGSLTWTTGSTEVTTYTIEHVCKTLNDCDMLLRWWPRHRLHRERVAQWSERTGGLGIVRGFVCSWGQPGVWQDFCEMFGTEQAIMLAIDEPASVHGLLLRIAKRKASYAVDEMSGARYDLIEQGGGTASCTVISPQLFSEFCAPYDRIVIDALHSVGHRVVYHTCGGMMRILDRIPETGTDASETLSPPGVGGNIAETDRGRVKRELGARVALIGGIDQHYILTQGSPEQVEAAVEACFAAYGPGGGYICSASDHFFEAPPENLKAMARAGARCRYGNSALPLITLDPAVGAICGVASSSFPPGNIDRRRLASGPNCRI